ncbi:hypothetical protein A8O14_06180 [Polynucleobacter wuianus]|uniref:protein-tyrosine-phosphatase n=2 Tax=Burkholderiaceae TaxID=119060 RepID=A0A191UIB7_9BURK|nr:hypothetical protein A8O14_06180 [Polynucleobacter wuianus]
MDKLRILTVCTANICRSPVAQLVLKEFLRSKEVVVTSAGIMAVNFLPAHKFINEIMHQEGYKDIALHQSHVIIPQMISLSDIILCMENTHLKWITEKNPSAIGKTRLLSHWSSKEDVPDPIGEPFEVFIENVKLIKQYCNEWSSKIVEIGFV